MADTPVSRHVKGDRAPRPRLLFYYFGFPHYRREILRALEVREDVDVRLMSGSVQKASISTLGEEDLSTLTVVPTWKIGPFTWDRGVLARGRRDSWDAVVLGPATTSVTTWLLLLWRRVLKRPTFLWGQCGRPADRSPKRFVQEVMNRLASGVLVYGRAEAAAAAELGLRPERVDVVFNATRQVEAIDDVDAYRRVVERAELARSGGVVRLTYVGRLVPDKRVDVLLEAAKVLLLRYPELRVDVVGGGPELERLRSLAPDGRTTFHDWVYDDNALDRILSETTLVVAPAHIGLLAVDALRFGVPVLFPDNPMNASEVEALTPGVNAIRFAAGQPESLAAAVDQWLQVAETLDAAPFERARREALQMWSPSNVANRIIDAVSR